MSPALAAGLSYRRARRHLAADHRGDRHAGRAADRCVALSAFGLGSARLTLTIKPALAAELFVCGERSASFTPL